MKLSEKYKDHRLFKNQPKKLRPWQIHRIIFTATCILIALMIMLIVITNK